MGAYTIFFFSTCRTTIFPFSTLTDTSEIPRLLNPYSIAAFSFFSDFYFQGFTALSGIPPPSCGRERHILALAGFEPARCPTVSGPLCPLSYSAIYRPQRRYAPGWVRLSGGLLSATRLDCHTLMCGRSFLLWDTTGSFQRGSAVSRRIRGAISWP